jgi:hypothetical protein
LSSTVPSSGGSRNVPVIVPSSSIRHDSRRNAVTRPSSRSLTCRCAAANRSSWLAVIGTASSARPSSVSGTAIRVSARTLEYDSRPAACSAVITGSTRSARATRTCSRAVPADIWHRHASHCAQLFICQLAHPPLASKSPSSTRNRHVTTVSCPASSQISLSSRSSGTSPAGSGTGAGTPAPLSMVVTAGPAPRSWTVMPGLPPGRDVSNMVLTLA